MIVDILNNNYNEYITNNKELVILDFGSINCGPCKILNSLLEEIHNEKGNVTIGKINIEENPDLAIKFGIISIPSMVFIKNNKVIEKINGLRDKDYIENIINNN